MLKTKKKTTVVKVHYCVKSNSDFASVYIPSLRKGWRVQLNPQTLENLYYANNRNLSIEEILVPNFSEILNKIVYPCILRDYHISPDSTKKVIVKSFWNVSKELYLKTQFIEIRY